MTQHFTQHFVQHLILCLTMFSAGVVKRSNIHGTFCPAFDFMFDDIQCWVGQTIQHFTEHFMQHLILCLTIFNVGLVKRSNIHGTFHATFDFMFDDIQCWVRQTIQHSLNISCNIWFYVWRYSMLGWSNDLTFHWTFENSRNFGWNIGLFLILSKFHLASLNIMLDDWTWLLNHPAFHWTRTYSEYGMRCWIVWPRLKKVILVNTLISSCFPLYCRCYTT